MSGGRQRTIELVPDTLVPKSREPVRPMTSKAAKKAHQQAQKGPRISKVEQRRLEREELERQRKEYERERAAAKAKAAREKKAEKAAAEKAARRKAGLPEPSKFVRPSQPTISMFVKSDTKRSWQEMNSVVEGTDELQDGEDEMEPPAKRVPIDRMDASQDLVGHSEDETNLPTKRVMVDSKVEDIVSEHENEQHAGRQAVDAEILHDLTGDRNAGSAEKAIDHTNGEAEDIVKEPERKDQHSSERVPMDDSEDEFGDFPSLSQPDILEELDSSIASAGKEEVILQKTGSPGQAPHSMQEVAPAASQELPKLKSDGDDEFSFDDDEMLAEMVNSQLMSEAADAARKPNSPQVSASTYTPPITCTDPGLAKQRRSGVAESIPKLNIMSEKVNNPPLLLKASKATQKSITQRCSPIPRGHMDTSQSENQTPSMRVVYGHSVSPDHSINKNGRVNQNHTTRQNHTANQGHTVDMDHAASQNFTIKQDETVNRNHTFKRAPPRPPKAESSGRTALQERSNNIMPPPKFPLNRAKAISFAPSFAKPSRSDRLSTKLPPNPQISLPPSSTQAFLDSHFDDFFPSPSQQVRELDNDINDLPSNTQIARELTDDSDDEKPIEKDDETGIEMLMCTQDLILSSQDLLEISTPTRAVPKRAKAPTPPRPKKSRFFEEKEEDLVHAAIHESKIIAAAQEQQKKIPLNDSFGTNYGDDFEEDISQHVAVTNASGSGISNPARRTMRRASSGVTDYGDDDLSEELLAALDGAGMSGSGELFC